MNSRISRNPLPPPPLPSPNSKRDVSVSFWQLYLGPWKGHQHSVSIESLINLDKTFFRISRIRVIAQTWFLARLFTYLSSFISQILDFLYWLVCIFTVDGVTVQHRRQGLHPYTMLANHVTKTHANTCRVYSEKFDFTSIRSPGLRKQLTIHYTSLILRYIEQNYDYF